MCHSVNILWEAWSYRVYEHGWTSLSESDLKAPGTEARR